MLPRAVRGVGFALLSAALVTCATGPKSASEGPRPRSDRPAPEADAHEAFANGFPLPADAQLFAETQSSLSYLTPLTARAVLAFYASELRGRYAFESIPNGIALKSAEAPFVYVTVSAYGDQVLVTLTRNALVDANAARVPAEIFGAPLPAGMTLFSRTPEVFVAHSRQPIAELCAWYAPRLPSGITRSQSDALAAYAYCMFTREQPIPHGAWTVVSIVPDHATPGVALVSVVGSP